MEKNKIYQLYKKEKTTRSAWISFYYEIKEQYNNYITLIINNQMQKKSNVKKTIKEYKKALKECQQIIDNTF